MGKTEERCCAAWLDGVRRGEASSGPGGVGVAGAERRAGAAPGKGACVCPGGS